MRPAKSAAIHNNLSALRHKRGLSAAELARLVAVSRQTIYAMEAGDYIPNTVVALKLARVLDASVEELFSLAGDAPAAQLRSEEASLLPGSEPVEPGQPVQLCRVDKRLFACPPAPVAWYLPSSDAVLTGESTRLSKACVEVFHTGADFSSRLLVAGCDPGISVLARHVLPAGIELVLAHRNSSQALELLKEGSVHVAGTHLRDEASGESNLPAISRLFPKNSVAVISFAVWEEGIVAARGNPKGIRDIVGLARRDVAIVNREPGSGSRLLLDSRLASLNLGHTSVRGYDRIAFGHLPAAWQVRAGAADACIATLAAARLFGLHFVPLVSERYDLAIRRQHLDLPAVTALLDALSRSSFRRELESLGGYDTRTAGRRML